MKVKKILAFGLAALMLVTCCGCEKAEKTAGKDGKIKLTVGFPKAEDSWIGDEYYNFITDKTNVDLEFWTMPADSATEKARIWISSGDMPDMVYMEAFTVDEYLKYGEQGVVKALPKDMDEKYPNIGFVNSMSGVYDELKERANGEMYMVMRPSDHYKMFIEDFRKAYAEGKDLRKMMSEDPKYMFIDSYGFAYRKDWAEKLGIKTDYIMEFDAFKDMAMKFKEADLGKVGKDNAVAIAVDYTEAPQIFVTAHNASYKYFHKDEETGKYVYGLLEDSTAEGVKEYAEAYRTGLLAPDFYTQKRADLNSVFCSQRSGIIFPKADITNLRTLYNDFEKANPGLKGEDCIGVCWILSPDGTVHARESGNGGSSGWFFNPEISDEKLEAALRLIDYCSSPEGGPQVRLGVPNVDYKQENGEYIVTREENEEGIVPTLDNKYPSYSLFRYLGNPHFDLSVDINPYAQKLANELKEAKLSNKLSVKKWDSDLDFYTEDDYVKFVAAYDVNNILAEIVVDDGDVEKIWEKKRKEIARAAEEVLKNMNNALVK